MADVVYRFARQKDASWNSYERQRQRYEIIKPFLGEGAVGAEIGVYKGGFGEFLLPHCRKLYLVDPWYRRSPYWGEPKPENSAVRALIEILQVYAEDIESGVVEVVPDFSVNFLSDLSAGSLDWIYLDASHQFEATLEELELSLMAVKPGGYITGDDYDPDPSSRSHGVFKAVNRVLDKLGISLEVCRSRQWVLRTATS